MELEGSGVQSLLRVLASRLPMIFGLLAAADCSGRYLIGLGVQQFAFDSFNIAYVVCAVLFFGLD
eukprot:2263810-Amphidinium_carterae.1